jgi:hypothetical protein
LTSKLSRLALAATVAAGASGLVAVPAQAAVNNPTLTAVTGLTPESVTLNGVIDTGNVAPGTNYVFVYDTKKDFLANGGQFSDSAQFAPEVPDFAAASTSLVAVSEFAGCYPMLICANLGAIPLTPKTTYVYQLQTQPGGAGVASSSAYASTQSLDSQIGTFTTPGLGSIAVDGSVSVRGRTATVLLTDRSVMPARGTATLTVRVGRRTFGVRGLRFRLAENATGMLHVRLAPQVVRALRRHRLHGRVSVTVTTDQQTRARSVTLAR